MADPTAFIRRTSAGISVLVEPPVADRAFDKVCGSYLEARSYARGLRLFADLPVVDEVGEGADA